MPRTCPDCASLIPDAFPHGLCPKCLLAAALPAPDAAPPDAAPPDAAPPDAAPPDAAPPEAAPASPWDAGRLRPLLPDLEILHLLGSGGMGAVFLARQPRLNRLVALKIMTCPPGQEAGFGLRFEREAQTLARLSHPHIVMIHDFGELDSEGTPLFYFLMEHVDGPDLGQRLKAKDLPPAQAPDIVLQICEALQHAHDQGITHRDIKPANILMDAGGTVKIADFGLAKMTGQTLAEQGLTGLTQTGTTVGTPHYMAPEQWEQPGLVDHRADLYALGVVFYEMLTGGRPIGLFPPPSRKNPGVSKTLDPVVLRALAKSPEDRYQQAGQMRADLLRITRPRVHAKGRGWLVAAAAVMLSGALLFPLLSRPAKPPAEDLGTTPAATAVKGSLTAAGTLRGGKPIDLSQARGITDFVQVCLHDYGWIGLRANGQTVSSDGRGERSGIRRILPGIQSRFTLLDHAGRVELVPMPGETHISSRLPEALGKQAVVNLVFDAWQGLALLEDGTAVAWGSRYDRPEDIPEWADKTPWQRPPAEALQKVRAIAITPFSASTVTDNGKLWLWGSSRAYIPANAQEWQGQYADIISTTSGLFDARLLDGHAVHFNLSTRSAQTGQPGFVNSVYGDYRPLHQKASGQWFGGWRTPELPPFLEKINGRPGSSFSLRTFVEDHQRNSIGLIQILPAPSPASLR